MEVTINDQRYLGRSNSFAIFDIVTSSLSGRVRGHQSVMYFYYSLPALVGVPMGSWGHLTAFLINILSVYNPDICHPHAPTHTLTSLIFCGCDHFSTRQCPLHCLCLPALISRPNLESSFLYQPCLFSHIISSAFTQQSLLTKQLHALSCHVIIYSYTSRPEEKNDFGCGYL